MSFGKNLLALRKSKGISQEELGSRLNVSRQTISKWELDDTTPEMEKLIMMSELFGVTIDELVKGPNQQPKIENDINDTNNIIAESYTKETKTTKSTKYIIFSILKIVGIAIANLVIIDIIVMIIYFAKNGFPSL